VPGAGGPPHPGTLPAPAAEVGCRQGAGGVTFEFLFEWAFRSDRSSVLGVLRLGPPAVAAVDRPRPEDSLVRT